MADAASDVSARLRAALSASHDVIERLPLAVSLTDGTITRPAYIGLIAQLWRLHETLEAQLDRRQTLGVFDERQRRAPTLRADLAALGADVLRLAAPSAVTVELQRAFEKWGTDDPWRLAGALYVFEGSRMGSMFIGPPVAQALGLQNQPGSGVDYHLEGVETRPLDWREFKSRLAKAANDPTVQESVIVGAVETMDGLLALYTELGRAADPTSAAGEM
ncbi:MAG TPA: biliverdin-producing heme oxygenase [Pirellulales bacterium]